MSEWVIGSEGEWTDLSGGHRELIHALNVQAGSWICLVDRGLVAWSVDGGNALRAFGRWAALQAAALWEADWKQPVVDFLLSGEGLQDARDASLQRRGYGTAWLPARMARMAATEAITIHSSWPKALPRNVHHCAGFAVQALVTDRALREAISAYPDEHIEVLQMYAGFDAPTIREGWVLESHEQVYHDAYLRELRDLTGRFNRQLESMVIDAWRGKETWTWTSLEVAL